MTQIQNHSFTSPLRYPGGKGALANFVKSVLVENALIDGDYIEVYAGGASIAISLLFEEYVQNVHINDISKPIMAFWDSILKQTDEFCKLIRETPVTMHEWHRQRRVSEHPDQYSPFELGFSTFFLNRTNRSGIIKGGVIGGKDQSGKWTVDCRFHKDDLVQRIQRIGRYRNRIHTYNLDANDFITTILPLLKRQSLVYLDPPYFKKGQKLYENHYGRKEHAEIAGLVSTKIRQPWIVSYDAALEILELYKQHLSLQYHINYSAQDRYAGAEVIFFSRHLKVPKAQNPTAIKLPRLQPALL
jgi:DNA adenine methylase